MADTLKEYLIALGFKVDENGWKGFNEKIIQSGKNVANLGATTVAVATEIGVTVEKIAKQYENLYYVSQRTKSSAGDLMAFSFGMRQIGSSTEAAMAVTEGWAASMRNNPGVRALFRGMGIDTEDSKKGIGQLVDRMKSQFGEGGYFIAQRYAAIAGIDESTFRQMWMNREKLRAQEDANRKRQKEAGIDADKYAKDSVKFGDALRGMQDRWGTLIDRVAIGWLPVATKVVEGLEGMAGWLVRTDVASKGWLGTIGSIVAALGSLKVAGAALGLAGRLVGLPGAAVATARGMGAGGLAMRLLGPVGAFAWGLGLGGEAQGATMPGGAGKAHPSEGGAGTSKDAAMAFYQKMGWSREQAAGLVANLHDESAMNHKAVGDGGSAYGLGQWHPDRQANFAKWAGKDIRDSSAQEQLEFVHYELTKGNERAAGDALRAAKTAREAGQIVSMKYERPAAVFEAARNRGMTAETILGSTGGNGGGNSISHKTEINVSGVSDPKKAASLVDESQKRVNGDIVRNTKSVFN